MNVGNEFASLSYLQTCEKVQFFFGPKGIDLPISNIPQQSNCQQVFYNAIKTTDAQLLISSLCIEYINPADHQCYLLIATQFSPVLSTVDINSMITTAISFRQQVNFHQCYLLQIATQLSLVLSTLDSNSILPVLSTVDSNSIFTSAVYCRQQLNGHQCYLLQIGT